MIRRFVITSPSTTRQLRDALDLAINMGTDEIPVTAREEEGNEVIEGMFSIETSRLRRTEVEFLGTLSDHGIAAINASRHPDFSDNPARLTLVGPATP